MTENTRPSIISDSVKHARLYTLGFKAGVAFDTVAFPVFWWELHLLNPDAAEALNRDLYDFLMPEKMQIASKKA